MHTFRVIVLPTIFIFLSVSTNPTKHVPHFVAADAAKNLILS